MDLKTAAYLPKMKESVIDNVLRLERIPDKADGKCAQRFVPRLENALIGILVA